MGCSKDDEIFCVKPKTLVKVIGVQQIFLNVIGFVVFGLPYWVLLEELKKVGFESASPDYVRISGLLLYGSIVIFITGTFLGIVLIGETYENESTCLKSCIVYAFVSYGWSMIVTVVHPDELRVLWMIMSLVLFGIEFWMIQLVVLQSDANRNGPYEEINCRSRLLPREYPLVYKYTPIREETV